MGFIGVLRFGVTLLLTLADSAAAPDEIGTGGWFSVEGC